MRIEKIEVIRIRVRDGYYVDITPNDEFDGFFDFWLHRTGYGISSFMFGCKVESETDAIELVEANVEDYIPDFEQEADDDC